MSLGFLDHMQIIRDHRIAGMVTYPLDELFLATLVGVVCGADHWDGVEEIAHRALAWLRGLLPFKSGVATARRSASFSSSRRAGANAERRSHAALSGVRSWR